MTLPFGAERKERVEFARVTAPWRTWPGWALVAVAGILCVECWRRRRQGLACGVWVNAASRTAPSARCRGRESDRSAGSTRSAASDRLTDDGDELRLFAF